MTLNDENICRVDYGWVPSYVSPKKTHYYSSTRQEYFLSKRPNLCGCRWYDSIIFDEDWFGSAFGPPENDYKVSEGRFANISTIYDPPLDDTDALRTLEYPTAINP